MPSPFPGMDPYLEAPSIWPDFHNALASEMRGWLNQHLPRPYYARLEMYSEVGVVQEEGGYVRRVVPDVAVVRHPAALDVESAVAVASSERMDVSQSLEVVVSSETIDHAIVEVRDPSKGHQLVTLIEIVSPTNKHTGQYRNEYLKKQTELLASDASLVELDLLRSGRRLLAAPELEAVLLQLQPAPDYLVSVNRSWKRREGRMACQLFPFRVTERLPCISMPLRENQPELAMDLQHLFQRVYDSGPYAHGAVDYQFDPHPPLPSPLQAWAQQLLRDAGAIPPSP